MRLSNRIAAVGGAISLAACAANPSMRIPTDLPDRIEYGRRMTISYAVTQAASDGARCHPIDTAVLDSRYYNSQYNAPGVVHSDTDIAADTFIRNQYSVCRASHNGSYDMGTQELLIAEFRTVGDAHYLRIGGDVATSTPTGFWTAVDYAASIGGDEPWQEEFKCTAPYTVVGGTAHLAGPVHCLPILNRPEADLVVPPPRDGLRGRQQPNDADTLQSAPQ